MKKNGILNSEISKVLSDMGHTDTICIGDCGLPIPDEVYRIDVAIKKGLPTFMEVLEEVANDMVIEKIVLAEEIQQINPKVFNEIKNLLGEIEIEFVSHEQFKIKTHDTKAIIRTGEYTAYANIILQSGVNF